MGVIASSVAMAHFAAAVPFAMPLTGLPPKGGIVTSRRGVLKVYSHRSPNKYTVFYINISCALETFYK